MIWVPPAARREIGPMLSIQGSGPSTSPQSRSSPMNPGVPSGSVPGTDSPSSDSAWNGSVAPKQTWTLLPSLNGSVNRSYVRTLLPVPVKWKLYQFGSKPVYPPAPSPPQLRAVPLSTLSVRVPSLVGLSVTFRLLVSSANASVEQS